MTKTPKHADDKIHNVVAVDQEKTKTYWKLSRQVGVLVADPCRLPSLLGDRRISKVIQTLRSKTFTVCMVRRRIIGSADSLRLLLIPVDV